MIDNGLYYLGAQALLTTTFGLDCIFLKEKHLAHVMEDHRLTVQHAGINLFGSTGQEKFQTFGESLGTQKPVKNV